MKILNVEAVVDNIYKVTDFVDEQLDEAECPLKTKLQLELAIEELFVNIANYAYDSETGMAEIGFEIENDPKTAVFVLSDSGKPYNPLMKEDPDVTLPRRERPIGGLGIFVVKNGMDDMFYEYKDGKNVLTLKKIL